MRSNNYLHETQQAYTKTKMIFYVHKLNQKKLTGYYKTNFKDCFLNFLQRKV